MAIDKTTRLGADVKIFNPDLVNIYGAVIGDGSRIGPFVEIQRGAVIGSRCKIQSHTFIPEGVVIEDDVFVGHGVMFTNDLWPRSVDDEGTIIGADGWSMSTTLVRQRAAIGSGVTILPVVIGESSIVGGGTVVTKDVPPFAIVVGNPSRVIGDVRERNPRNPKFVSRPT